MGLLSYDLLSKEVKEQKIGPALKFEIHLRVWRSSLCLCADPWRTATALATMNGDSRRCPTIEDENWESPMCFSLCLD